MAHDSVDATRGFPVYSALGAPADAADLSEIAAWAGANIDRVALASYAALASQSPLYTGRVEKVATLPGALFVYDGSAWQMVGVPRLASLAALASALPSPITNMVVQIVTERFARVYTGSTWVPVGGEFTCHLGLTATQNFTTSFAPVVWNYEYADPRNMHDNVTNPSRITPVEPGIYLATFGGIETDSTAGHLSQVQGRLNGTTDIPNSQSRLPSNANALSLQSIFAFEIVNATDYLEIMITNSAVSGGMTGAALGAGAGSTGLLVQRLAAAA